MDRLVTDSLTFSARWCRSWRSREYSPADSRCLQIFLLVKSDGQRRRSYYTHRILSLELVQISLEVLSRVAGSILGHRYRFRPRRFQDNAELINTHNTLEDANLQSYNFLYYHFSTIFLSNLLSNRRYQGEISIFLKVTCPRLLVDLYSLYPSLLILHKLFITLCLTNTDIIVFEKLYQ